MSAGAELERVELLKLWKGIYYALWMQDGPLRQEDLMEAVVELGRVLERKPSQVLLNWSVGVETLGREWGSLDRWRVDKFLLLLRRLTRATLAWIARKNWRPKLLTAFLHSLQDHLLASQPLARRPRCPQGPLRLPLP